MLHPDHYDVRRMYPIIMLHCVVPENFHTSTTEGISCKSPSPSWNFHLLNTMITLHPSRISKIFMYTPDILREKIVLARKGVEVEL